MNYAELMGSRPAAPEPGIESQPDNCVHEGCGEETHETCFVCHDPICEEHLFGVLGICAQCNNADTKEQPAPLTEARLRGAA
jgi:hypothetical protein